MQRGASLAKGVAVHLDAHEVVRALVLGPLSDALALLCCAVVDPRAFEDERALQRENEGERKRERENERENERDRE